MSKDEPFDPYAELQLSPDAEPELVKAAFKALAKKYHPDRFTDPVEKARAEEKMARLNKAQQLLASGRYTPPPPPVSPPPPPPPTPPSHPRPKRAPAPPPKAKAPAGIGVKPLLAVVIFFVALLFLPGLFAENNLKRALEFEKQGRLQDSLLYLNKAVEDDPHDRELYRHRARLWEKLGEPEKAARDLKNAQVPQLSFPTPVPTSLSSPNQVQDASGENTDSHVP